MEDKAMKRLGIGFIVAAACSAMLIGEGLEGRWVRWRPNFGHESVFAGNPAYPRSWSGQLGSGLTSPAKETLVFTFKVDGQELTGTVRDSAGTFPIKNGKVSGEQFTFEIEHTATTIWYEGRISKDKIRLSSWTRWNRWSEVLAPAAD
jgi:hypothetical protein